MIPTQIETTKQEYTDKYVVVDASRPELARFRDLVGQVKTVNMSGRALVEFADYHLNIGWFDIDLDYLKVVDKPAPKEPAAKKKAPAKPAAKAKPDAASGEKKLSPLEMARAQGAGGGTKPAAKDKPSTADILAAARGGTAAKSAPADDKPAKPKGKMSTADILAAARGGAAPAAKEEKVDSAPTPAAEKPAPAAKAPTGKVDRSKMSVAEMIAMAKGEKAGGAAAAAEPAEEAANEPEQAAETATEPEAAPEPATDGGVVKVDRSSMSVDDMIAYCREKDAG